MELVLSKKQTFVYKVVDGLAIHADVYRASEVEPRPAVMWIHGGALIMGNRTQIATYQLQYYLEAGFSVVAIDYRLAPEAKLPATIEDLRDAYAWILREGPAIFGLDGERVAVVGHSAGGYLTLVSGYCATARPKALVSFYGYGDLIGSWYSRPDPFYSQQFPPVSIAEALTDIGTVTTDGAGGQRFRYYLHCRQTGRWPLEVAGHDPDRDAEWFAPYCPLQNVDADYPPTLLIHGLPDTDVPYEQSVLMQRELSRKGIDHELITLSSLGHGFDTDINAENSVEVSGVFARVTAFLRSRV
jgi:acetyl esterase/lipase